MDQLHGEIRIWIVRSVFRVSRIPTGERCGEFRREVGLGEEFATGSNGRNSLGQRNGVWGLGSGGD